MTLQSEGIDTRFYMSLRAFILLSAFMAMALACVLAYFLAAVAG